MDEPFVASLTGASYNLQHLATRFRATLIPSVSNWRMTVGRVPGAGPAIRLMALNSGRVSFTVT
jgi:hypothetical protein